MCQLPIYLREIGVTSDSASFMWRRLMDSSGKLANLPIIKLKRWWVWVRTSSCVDLPVKPAEKAVPHSKQ